MLSAAAPAPRPASPLLGAGVVLLGAAAAGLLLLAGQVAALEWAYPAAALLAGAALHRRPAAYVALTWWAFFLTPEVRRLVDYAGGWSPVSPVMLAPFLVLLPAVVETARSARLWGRPELLPFAMALAGVVPGYAVGVLRHGVASPTFDLLEWAAPVCFGLYTVRAWGAYPDLRDAVARAFTWGVVGVGAYAVAQFFLLPPWDAFWMEHSGMHSIGVPEPLGVRVFGPLNAPGPLAAVLMAGLLLLIVQRGPGRWAAQLAGYPALLLTLVRTAWLGWAVGAGLLVARVGHRHRGRLLAGLAIAVLLTVALSGLVPALDGVAGRFGTLGDLEGDHSFRQRLDLLTEMGRAVLGDPLGHGLGSTGRATKLTTGTTRVFDNGVVNLPFVLGWIGALLYGAGALLLAASAVRGRRAAGRTVDDPFVAASAAIGVAMLVQMVSVNTLVGLFGMLFWGFCGLAVAGRLWAEDQTPDASPADLLPDAPPSPPLR